MVVSALVALCVSACAGEAPSIAGCYDVAVGAWTRPVGGDSLTVTPPARIELDTSTVDLWDGETAHPVRPAPGVLPSIHRGNIWWKPIGADSIQLFFAGGHSGMEMRLEPNAAGLAGVAVAHFDYADEYQAAPVAAARVPCDAPVAEEDRLRYRYPIGIARAGGDSVRLGDPVPRDWAIGPTRGGADRPALEPPYHDADSISVFAASQGIYTIRLLYPDSLAFDVLRERLAARFGAPGEGWSGEEEGRSHGWGDRLVWIRISAGAGSPVTATISHR